MLFYLLLPWLLRLGRIQQSEDDWESRARGEDDRRSVFAPICSPFWNWRYRNLSVVCSFIGVFSSSLRDLARRDVRDASFSPASCHGGWTRQSDCTNGCSTMCAVPQNTKIEPEPFELLSHRAIH